MNVEATQLLDNTCVTGTLILKEVNRDVIKNEEPANTEAIYQNADPDKKVILKEISNYCLKLINTALYDQTDNFLMPLFIGLNKIGRSNSSDLTIVDSNVSKSHAIIEVKVSEEGQLNECLIHDQGSLNKITINTKRFLEKNGTCKLQIDDKVVFGSIGFRFSQVI